VRSSGGSLGAAVFDRFCHAHAEARQYTDTDGLRRGKVALAYQRKSDHEADTFAAATSEAAMKEWIAQFLDGPSRPPLNNVPVHFLLTAPASVPGEPVRADDAVTGFPSAPGAPIAPPRPRPQKAL
jgi:hypothetical protein